MADTPSSTPVTPERRLGFQLGLLCFALGLWLTVVAAVALVGIYDIRANDFALAKAMGFRVPTDAETLSDVRIALQTMLGASLGACLLSFLGLFQYAVTSATFVPRFLGSYLIGPVAVVFLGLAVFILARAGLFVFGNVSDTTKITTSNELSFLGLGILIGFSWNHVLAKIAEIGAQVFASTKQISTRTPGATPAAPVGAAQSRAATPPPDRAGEEADRPKI
jgi:hypothetical protein